MNKKYPTISKDRYFTLLELLVVIAIIGILLTILMPSLKNARKSAKRAVCLSNQKQLGAAMMTYTVNNNLFYPIFGDKFADDISWDDQLGDYDGRDLTDAQKRESVIKENDYPDMDNSLYECPSNVMVRRNQYPRSYSINDSYNKDEISDDRAIRGVAGWRDKKANEGQPDEYKYSIPWSTHMSRIADEANFIVLFDFQSYGNETGHCSGGSGYNTGRDLAGNWAPENLPKHSSDPATVAGFYVHESGDHLNAASFTNPNRPYRHNFLFGDGRAQFISVPGTFGSSRASFYSANGSSWGELKETGWNALNAQ